MVSPRNSHGTQSTRTGGCRPKYCYKAVNVKLFPWKGAVYWGLPLVPRGGRYPPNEGEGRTAESGSINMLTSRTPSTTVIGPRRANNERSPAKRSWLRHTYSLRNSPVHYQRYCMVEIKHLQAGTRECPPESIPGRASTDWRQFFGSEWRG